MSGVDTERKKEKCTLVEPWSCNGFCIDGELRWQQRYIDVFNLDGSQKICGRQKCSQLIEAMEKAFPGHESLYFGDKRTGQMHVRHILDTAAEYIKTEV